MKKHTVIILLLVCILLFVSCVNSKYARVVGDYDTSALKGSFISSDNEADQIGKNSWAGRCLGIRTKHGKLSLKTML